MTTPLKRAYFVRRNPALSAAEFPQRWKQHSQLGAQFPDLLARHSRVLYCLADHARGGAIGASQAYDGVGLLFVSDAALIDTAPMDPNVLPTMRADELRVFHQNVFNSAIVAKEHILKDGPDGKIGILSFTRRHDGVTREALHAAFTQSGLAATVAYQRNIRKHIEGEVVGEPTIDFDAMTELWFDSVDDAVATWNDSQFHAAWLAMQQPVVDATATMVFLTEVCHERKS